jgi:hypothetical protein
MSNLFGCSISEKYGSLLFKYTSGSVNFINTGYGHSYCNTVQVCGSVTGSQIRADSMLVQPDLTSSALCVHNEGTGTASISKQGYLKLEERSTEPSLAPSGSGSVMFMNNALWYYGEL